MQKKEKLSELQENSRKALEEIPGKTPEEIL